MRLVNLRGKCLWRVSPGPGTVSGRRRAPPPGRPGAYSHAEKRARPRGGVAALVPPPPARQTRASAAGVVPSLGPQTGSLPESPQLKRPPCAPGALPSQGQPASSEGRRWERKDLPPSPHWETRALCRVAWVGSCPGGPLRNLLSLHHRRKEKIPGPRKWGPAWQSQLGHVILLRDTASQNTAQVRLLRDHDKTR